MEEKTKRQLPTFICLRGVSEDWQEDGSHMVDPAVVAAVLAGIDVRERHQTIVSTACSVPTQVAVALSKYFGPVDVADETVHAPAPSASYSWPGRLQFIFPGGLKVEAREQFDCFGQFDYRFV
ncbi:MAG: hypothetical protein KGJ74_07185 [Betaproteobacteria bacterium]|jgi:hypothetical protein|nr:hypothetical protein [Betaproteobacteria bacterium]OZB45405.1 MAG: hypothetical protein B7X46_04765 [Thiomonas sp. 15-66-11]